MRAAIYARFSSENQNERSIDDQVRLCREFIERNGGMVAGVYADYAISGAHLRSRPQALRLLEDAKAGRFDTVVSEALDRLSRDQEDTAAIHKRLGFAGVRLVTVSEGDISELHVGLKGTMNALFLRDLAAKVKRGQRGRALAGSVPCGLSYGYDIVRGFDERGRQIRGQRRVNPDQAAVIREIFDKVGIGFSPRAIAADLNRRGVPAPRGAQWNASTINGNPARRNGILYNEAYIGVLIFDRLRFVKDPESGKRVPRLRRPEEWVLTEVPELRIVTDEQWDRVQQIKAGYSHLRFNKTVRPKHLLSGLVFCGGCGGSYTIKTQDYLACSRERESGTCNNTRTVRIDKLEQRVMAGLTERLLSPKAVALFVDTYREERRRIQAEAARERSGVEQRLTKVTKQIANIVDAIADGISSPSMREKLVGLEAEKAEAEATLAAIVAAEGAGDSVVELHPVAAERYRRMVEALTTGSNGETEEERREAMNGLRSLIGRVEVHPGEGRGEFHVTVFGLIEELLSRAELTGTGERSSGAVGLTAQMVAAE